MRKKGAESIWSQGCPRKESAHSEHSPTSSPLPKENVLIGTSANHFHCLNFPLYSVSSSQGRIDSLFLHIMKETSAPLMFLVFLATSDTWNILVERQVSERPGIAASKTGECPPSHSIKGNFTTHSGERCIYHMPRQHFYAKTKAERCYATEKEARQDGCRKAKV